MTVRSHIDKRLAYSCNCGWVDKGHASLGAFKIANNDITESAANLWKQMKKEWFRTEDTIDGKPCFRVAYRQSMGKTTNNEILKSLFTIDGKTLFKVSTAGHYLVRTGLSIPRKEEIALRIFLDVSYGFESMQAGFPFFLSSGFSQEDLISNLIGFYVAVRGVSDAQIQTACKFVSKKASLDVWDNNIKKDGKIGDVKNKDPSKPKYYPCPECKGTPQFPALLKSIKRANLNGDFIRYKRNPVLPRNQPKRNFDRNGNVKK